LNGECHRGREKKKDGRPAGKGGPWPRAPIEKRFFFLEKGDAETELCGAVPTWEHAEKKAHTVVGCWGRT